MKDYIPNFFAYYLFFPKFFTEYLMVSEDKELTYQVLKSMDIRQPNLLFQYKNGRFYSHNKSILSDDEVNDLIKKTKAEKLFMKPTMGLGGKGIMVFNKNKIFTDEEGNQLSAEFIKKTLGKKDNYLVQEGLIQHEEINKIYPKSINTIRAYTEVKNGEAKFLFALLRMGHGGKQIDNASQKGYVCRINPEKGELASYATSRLFEKTDHHPDTNFKFDGYKIPFWDEIKDFVLVAAQKNESIGYVGWDIAYTKDGPSVIEINAAPGLHSLQENFGGVREAFGIKNPKSYWYSTKFIMQDK
ncbi:sugar-transfer associated ATP-grasp domain-containing protein [Maribellus comscasis]|nr:sugar-transfer associated ATP-grasp domain-containing protein [Maribellus comscasis]